MIERANRFLLGHTMELVVDIFARPAIPADLTISRFFASRRYLGSHDRGYIAETTYALLRDVIRLQMGLGELLASAHRDDRPYILAAAFLVDRGIDRTLVADATEIPERDVERLGAALAAADAGIDALEPSERAAMRHSLPVWLADRLRGQYGDEDADALMAALKTQAPIVLRANRLATTPEALIAALEELAIEARTGELSPDAVVLARRINAFTVPQFKQGWFELQDEGSQLLSLALDPHPNWRVFDACAGAGGKTLHLAAIMKGRGEVIAHDINDRRLAELRPRLKRSGAQNVRIMDNATYLQRRESMLGELNAVMIDAPCSGTGVLRRNPGVRLTIDESTVERLLPQQAQILDEYAALVRPGGLMLYATCSLLREENDAQVEAFLDRTGGWERVAITLPADVVDADGYYRAFPHRHGTDGFFGALLRRV